MIYFDYPIDTKMLLRKKKSIKRELLAQNTPFLKKRIAILGGSTTNEVADQLELFLLNYGIKAEIYQSEYGMYMEDALFGNPQLDSFHPDLVYIHTSWRNITAFPRLTDSIEDIDALLEQEFTRFSDIWASIEHKFGCPIIQNNFDRPNYRLLGNRDASDAHGRTHFISQLNQKVYRYSQTHGSFFVNDLDYLAADYGLTAWSNPLYWHMYKYAMPMDAIPCVADSVAKIIKAIYGKNKKALILDLDNTLWGGVIGEDGLEGIALGPELPKGQIYSEFQAYCKAQKDIGVILGINSKNDEENALSGLKHPDSVLNADDFVSIKANWNSKDSNLIAMAEELSLGSDSFVFIDDNPAEREIIRKQLPVTAVPEIDSVENYIRILDHSGFFEVVSLSAEDAQKTKLYHAKAEAARAVAAFSDYGEYLDSLKMNATIKPFDDLFVQRIAQLTNKSNQFNLTTLRCSEDDIRKMINSQQWITLYGKLEDKFGDNGVVTVVAGELIGSELHIRLWLMSCRVLKRDMEYAMMDTLVEKCKALGLDSIIGYYYPTPKNNMVKDFYALHGFHNISSDEALNTTWRLSIQGYQNGNHHITVLQ